MSLGSLRTDKTVQETRAEIRNVFRKWGLDDWEILPKAAGDDVATVEFYLNGEKKSFSCKRFWDYRTNLRALYLILDPVRLAQERGILEELARMATAFLPSGSETSKKRPWYEVLQVTPTTSPEVVKASYQALAKQRHPDSGGSEDAMRELNAAFEEFEAARGAPA